MYYSVSLYYYVCVFSIYCNNYFTFANILYLFNVYMCSRASRPNAKIKVLIISSFSVKSSPGTDSGKASLGWEGGTFCCAGTS